MHSLAPGQLKIDFSHGLETKYHNRKFFMLIAQRQVLQTSVQETESVLKFSSDELNPKTCNLPKKLDVVSLVTAEDFNTPAVYFIPENLGELNIFQSIISSI